MTENIQEGFVTCPRCRSQLCYSQQVGSEETWMCLSCGFTSTTVMKQGTETEKQVSDRQPRLYKELKFVDNDEYVWYPAVLSVPEKGIVYLDGTSVEDSEWVGIPIRELTKKEKRMPQYKGKKFLLDPKNTQHFGKDGFVLAMGSLGMI